MKASLLLLPSLLIVGLSAWMPPAAIAGSETCKNVNITMRNSTPDEIQITKLEYFESDRNKWHTETGVFGIDGKQNLERNQPFTVTRDLEKVDNDPNTKIKVTYRHRIGGDKYEPSVTETSSNFTCRDNMPKEVVLDK